MRYFVEIAYKGTPFFGWQRQPNQRTVQGEIESALSLMLRQEISITGCGRTDTGVHARQYFFHFDGPDALPPHLLDRLNKYLPKDIALYRIFEVADDAHARFDAISRSYEYRVIFKKDPFQQQTAYFFPFEKHLDRQKLRQAAELLLSYNDFTPFCKTKSDAKTMLCQMHRSEWITDSETGGITYHVTANRFLRGMIRLIVGMCLNVGTGKLELSAVEKAMEEQSPLPLSWSVPADGLYLKDIRYGER